MLDYARHIRMVCPRVAPECKPIYTCSTLPFCVVSVCFSSKLFCPVLKTRPGCAIARHHAAASIMLDKSALSNV